MDLTYKPLGKYYEEFETNQQFVTPSRTITETDVVTFAWISGDWNPPHTDKVFAEKTSFKQRIAHGPLILSASIGLLFRTGVLDGTSMALLDTQWVFKSPVFLGDTITCLVEVEAKKECKKLDRGVITFKVKTYKQDKSLTGEGKFVIMMGRQL